MRSRLGKTLVAVLLIVSIGGHWAFLQSVAWVTMVVDFSKEASLSVAVSKTFDGKHPCQLCQLVKRGKQSEKKREAIKAKAKTDYWICEREVFLPGIELARVDFVPFNFSLKGRGDSPPIPPPKLG